MLDFVWLDRDGAGYHAKTGMGVEIEWASKYSCKQCLKEVAFDFRKLLCFKAPIKLFIFDCPEQMGGKVIDSLHNCLNSFIQHTKGELYILIEFYKNKETHLYEQRSELWYVNEDGVVPKNIG